MVVAPSSDSVASRVRRNPRAASRVARNRLTALFSAPEWEWDNDAWAGRSTARSERVSPVNCRYMLRSMRR